MGGIVVGTGTTPLGTTTRDEEKPMASVNLGAGDFERTVSSNEIVRGEQERSA